MGYIILIPASVIIIIAMLVGSIQIGSALRVIGILMLLCGLITFIVSRKKDKYSKSNWIGATLFFGYFGLIILLIGIWFGDHNIFEFLFGTGLF